MAVITITKFGGEAPSTLPRSLPAGFAQLSRNLMSAPLDFHPLPTDLVVGACPAGSTSVYRFNGALLASVQDINFVKGQIDDDSTGRTYYTDNTAGFAPRAIDASSTGLSSLATAGRRLGVPPPSGINVTLAVVDEVTQEEADYWVNKTLVPSITQFVRAAVGAAGAERALIGGQPVVGPTNLYGMQVANYPVSQRGVLELWNLLYPVTQAQAEATGLSDPRLGARLVAGTWWYHITAVPGWHQVHNVAALTTHLLTIQKPLGGPLWEPADAQATADGIAARLAVSADTMKPQRTALEEAVRDFRTAMDFILTAPVAPPTAPPTKPATGEYVYDQYGDMTRSAEWVAYDAALLAYQQGSAAAQANRATRSAEVSSRINAMVSAQARAATLTVEIERASQLLLDGLGEWLRYRANLNLFQVQEGGGAGSGVVELTRRSVEPRFYIATYVTDWGEESAPSPVSTMIEADQNDTASITIPSPPPDRAITRWRLYRSNAGSTGGSFQGLHDGTISDLTFFDNYPNAALQEPCPTITWVEPPAQLRGLVGMANGIMAGHYENTICFCDPYHPYAWPIEYQITVEYTVVGLAAFGQSLFVGTWGNPYLISGSDSASMSATKLESNQACMSARSIVAAQGGVIYASPDGLCFASPSGVQLLTSNLWTRDDWQKIQPKTIVAVEHEGVYLFTCGSPGARSAYAFYQGKLTRVDVTSAALFVDKIDDSLYAADGTAMVRVFGGVSRRTGIWRSPPAVLARQEPIAWAKVYGNQSQATPVIVRWYGDGVLRHTATFTDMQPQRLPSGRYLEHEVEIESQARVSRVVLASSTQELQAI
ncbi:MAG TPA: hypothetical protein PLE48_13375 [Thiobacillus sp.]|uniref:hypothetical protein n=1 Tax=Acidovorax sp. TaxID=1872122 RepID=UPI00262A3065|nr:hypothetical protein [Acidovorax sp.]HQT19575.1 hypothetical protein [Acidovorax defluvii]HQT71397.1 hypothetical protein [Thiobacillus sp.]